MLDSEYTEAFEKAYSQYLHRLVFYAVSFVRDGEAAESLVQDVYLKLWEKRAEIDHSRDLLPYLITMTRNSCLNYLRSKKNSEKYVQYRIDRFNADVLSNAETANVFGREVSRLVAEAMAEMPQTVRDTFLLSRNTDMMNKEIADFQHISISTVEYRISYAFKVLRKKLKDYLPFLLWFLMS
jgi:RNA polymerase sigma-70 factor (ECF subfamily)